MLKRVKGLLAVLLIPLLLTGCLGTGPEGTPTVTVQDGRTTISTQMDAANNSTVTVAGVNPSYRAGETMTVTLTFQNYNLGPMDTKFQVRLLNLSESEPQVYTETQTTLLQIGVSQRQTEAVRLTIPPGLSAGDYRVNVFFGYFGKENKVIADGANFNIPTTIAAR